MSDMSAESHGPVVKNGYFDMSYNFSDGPQFLTVKNKAAAIAFQVCNLRFNGLHRVLLTWYRLGLSLSKRDLFVSKSGL